MNKNLLSMLLMVVSFATFAQPKMRTLEELINKEDPGWPFVEEWVRSAKNNVEVLPVDTEKAKTALYHTQVTTRSPMGSIVYMSGGILVDHGWIRILGSGNAKLSRTLPDWNKGKTYTNTGEPPKSLLIADDVLGGFFILNGGGLGADVGKVYYFSPDNLKYEPLGLSYTEFLNFCFNNDLDEFYKGYRWPNWKKEVVELSGDKVYTFFPFLWSKEGQNISKSTRKEISIEEQYWFNMNARKELKIE